MNPENKEFIISELSFFAGLSKKELAIINAKSQVIEYRKGQIIYEEGSAPSAFYCIISGRVQIYTKDKDGNQLILEYLHRGKYFGIISLLTNETHSVTSEAMNDCAILVIQKDDFNPLLQSIPHLAIDLSRSLSRRLKRKDIHQKKIFESTVISVFSSYAQAGKTVYALNLALSLNRETHKSVIVLDILAKGKIHTLPQKLQIQQPPVFDLSSKADIHVLPKDLILKNNFGIELLCFYYEEDNDSCLKRLIEILSILVNDYHYIILDLPAAMDRSIISMLNQSDLIHILSSPDACDLKRTNNLISRLKKDFNFDPGKIKTIINEYKLSKIGHSDQSEILGQDIFATIPKIKFDAPARLIIDAPDCEYSQAVRRIARQLGDCLVGLVLGVGVGYGFCHLGVLKVIEEENIPVDIIVGSSIGALIASLWAVGKSSGEILEILREFKEPKHIWGLIDITFPRLGFIKGNKLYRFLKKHLGDKTFYDVKLPLKIIASDVHKKEPKILDKGLLVDAIMASCSMPGVFAPFKFKEEVLFDGGVTYPLPTEPLMQMGVKKIIAVNVTPSREDILNQLKKLKEGVPPEPGVEIQKTSRPGLLGRLKNFFNFNIVDIIFSSVEVLQSEVARREGELADIVLHPDTTGLFWLELHKADEFAKRGEAEARKHLARIWQLVNE
ncbi:MAG: patatin-like phospholipase family protein [Candidatus Omnitrophica bacterium]|nr:patatin-like phospholipase family protein [Candidatus Omnitrophota bacterium]MBU4467525.1 patatin-like phospholipase family protein [Candidatus Omnitrophota bacterium]MCG2713285.1 patatin-like phospholipase family protein [Candidatus Omnitrophota bacterium]